MAGYTTPATLSVFAAFLLAATPVRAQGYSDTIAGAQVASAALAPAATASLSDGRVASLLRGEARDWDGTRYRLGGASRSGIDCSALMQRWFGDLFDAPLPRTAREQFDEGLAIDEADLRPGDLVFFGSRRSRITHVGVYVGDGEFAHASRSQGVTVSRLAESYWARRYQGARRVLDAVEASALPPPAAELPTVSLDEVPVLATHAPTFTRASAPSPRTSAPTRRVGW